MMSIDLRERALGSLLGLAVADSLRCQRPSLKAKWKTELKQGEYSSETALALCVAESLLECKSFDAQDLIEKFSKWLSDGINCSRWKFDDKKTKYVGVPVGPTAHLSAAVERYHADPKKDPFHGGNLVDGASVVRLAPIAIYYRKNLPRAMEVSVFQGSMTHNTSEANDACAYLTQLVARILNGEPLKDAMIPLSDSPIRNKDIRSLFPSSAKWRLYKAEQLASLSARALSTLEAALWCVTHSSNFRDAVSLAVNSAGDAEAVASVTGEIAGALYGVRSIPKEWLEKLCNHDEIKARAAALYDRAPFDKRTMGIDQDTSGVIVKPKAKL